MDCEDRVISAVCLIGSESISIHMERLQISEACEKQNKYIPLMKGTVPKRLDI